MKHLHQHLFISKWSVLVFALMLNRYVSFAQDTDSTEKDDDYAYCNTVDFDSASFANYMSFYNSCDSVVCVSIELKMEDKTHGYFSTVIGRDAVDESRLTSIRQLTEENNMHMYKALYEFSDVFYNAFCYEPRHGIAYYKDGEVVAFIEICFQCSRIELFGFNDIIGMDLCPEHQELLQKALEIAD